MLKMDRIPVQKRIIYKAYWCRFICFIWMCFEMHHHGFYYDFLKEKSEHDMFFLTSHLTDIYKYLYSDGYQTIYIYYNKIPF